MAVKGFQDFIRFRLWAGCTRARFFGFFCKIALWERGLGRNSRASAGMAAKGFQDFIRYLNV
jgi:hypothetical protein